MSAPSFDPWLLGIPVVGSRHMPDGDWYLLDVGLPGGPVLLVQEVDPPTVPGEVACGWTHLALGRCPRCGAVR